MNFLYGNIVYDCVLLYWRHLPARLLYNDFGRKRHRLIPLCSKDLTKVPILNDYKHLTFHSLMKNFQPPQIFLFQMKISGQIKAKPYYHHWHAIKNIL